ncbi:unnamed protein product [Discula destructiva]
MNNFKFTSPRQSEVQVPTQVTRFSKRLSTNIEASLKPTKLNLDTKTSPSRTKKRKANTLADKAFSDPLNDTTLDNAIASTLDPQKSRKKARKCTKSGYEPPSTFAHLGCDPLPDALGPNLFVLFCGLNPGIMTATTGHAYSSPTNRFWKIMYSSSVLPVPCSATEDRTLPARFNLGLTNIVARPSRNGAQLSAAEMDAGVPDLEGKVRRWRPEVVCLVGKGIWESVWRVHHGGKAVGKAFHKEFTYGWQDESERVGLGDVDEDEKQEGVVYDGNWKGARVFVASSTSGLAATLKPAEKERIWRELGEWVEKRRHDNENSEKGVFEMDRESR